MEQKQNRIRNMAPFLYCLPLFHSYLTSNDSNRLQVIQNSCTRYCYNLSKFEHISPILKNKNILKLSDKGNLMLCTTVYNILKTKKPDFLHKHFTKRHESHSVPIRSYDNLSLPLFKTTKFKKSFIYNGITLHNKYKTIFLRSNNIKSFSRQIKQAIFANKK
jgi:hypothetical protein